jgi:hypothetical protein
MLKPDEAEWFRSVFTEGGELPADRNLSAEGREIYSLLTSESEDEAETALHRFPAVMQERLTALSPVNYLNDVHVPLFVHLHDISDQVIPVGESRLLHAALDGRAGVHYTEMQFSHLDPAKGKLPLFRLLRELVKFFIAVYPLFLQTTAS